MHSRFALLLSLLLVSSALFADGIDLLDYELKDLNTGETIALEKYRGNAVVLMFFEPDCPFCARQVKVLEALAEQCSGLQPLAIGVNGSPIRLRRELTVIRPGFPAYQASARLNNDVGQIEGTPIMLIADRNGNFVTHLRGLQDKETLLQILKALSPGCEPAAPVH